MNDVRGEALSTNAAQALKAIGGLQKLVAAFKTDEALENDGAWMIVADGVRWKVRSAQAERVRTVMQDLVRPFRAVFASGGRLTVAQQNALEVEQCALALVVDWEGMTDTDGQALSCTDIHVRELVTSLPHLRRQVVAFSEDLSNFRPAVNAMGAAAVGVAAAVAAVTDGEKPSTNLGY